MRSVWGMLVGAATAALFSGCAVAKLNAGGAKVEVTTSAEGCKFLGTVMAREGMNGRGPETNIQAVQADLRNKAANIRGNRIVITSQQLGTPAAGSAGVGCPSCITMMASVYRCAAADEP